MQLILCVAAIAALANAATDAGRDERPYLGVGLVDSRDSAVLLRVRLTNLTAHPVSLNEGDLPWANRYAMTLVAVAASGRGGPPLDQALPIDDPVVGQRTLNPGAYLEGTINLAHRFRGLGDALERGEVLILWSYQARPIDASAWRRLFGGTILRGGRARDSAARPSSVSRPH